MPVWGFPWVLGQPKVTLDAFNLVATVAGLVDRALLLIDPSGSIAPMPGNVVLPLVANRTSETAHPPR